MKSYLYRLFTGLLHPSENIKADSEEYKAALRKLIETQNQLKDRLSKEQLSMLDEMLAQKDMTVAFETFEAFLAGAKLVFGIWQELAKD